MCLIWQFQQKFFIAVVIKTNNGFLIRTHSFDIDNLSLSETGRVPPLVRLILTEIFEASELPLNSETFFKFFGTGFGFFLMIFFLGL